MGRFQATVSTVAALTTIFAAGATGWKLAQPQQPPADNTDKTLQELRAKVAELESKPSTVVPEPVTPPPVPLPAVPPPPSSSETDTEGGKPSLQAGQ